MTLEKIEHSETGKSIEEHNELVADLQKYRGSIAQTTNSLQQALRTKLALMRQIEVNAQKLEELKLKKEGFQADALKIFLTNSTDPDKYHLG